MLRGFATYLVLTSNKLIKHDLWHTSTCHNHFWITYKLRSKGSYCSIFQLAAFKKKKARKKKRVHTGDESATESEVTGSETSSVFDPNDIGFTSEVGLRVQTSLVYTCVKLCGIDDTVLMMITISLIILLTIRLLQIKCLHQIFIFILKV